MTVAEVGARMSSREVAGWMAFDQIRHEAQSGPPKTDEEIAAEAMARIAGRKNADAKRQR